jgi:hypothetical protein
LIKLMWQEQRDDCINFHELSLLESKI